MSILEGREAAERSGLFDYLRTLGNFSPIERSRLSLLIGQVRDSGSSRSRSYLDEYCRLNGKYPKLKEYIDRAIEFDLGDWEPDR